MEKHKFAFEVTQMISYFFFFCVGVQTDMLESDSFSGYQFKSVLAEAVRQFPKNTTLWVKSLKAEFEQKEEEPLFQIDTGASEELPPAGDDEKSADVFVELPALFWEAIKALGPTSDSIPVWETAIEHYKALCNQNTKAIQTVENLYEKALSIEPPVGNHFKPLYLSWIATQKGFDIFLFLVNR